MEISEEEYRELQQLKHNAEFEKIYLSAASPPSVWDDIDAPIRPVIGALALLGCETLWSCCGYDYPGQPIHKSHEYGNCGVAMLDTEHTNHILSEIISGLDGEINKRPNMWKTGVYDNYGVKQVHLGSDIRTGNSWPSPESIHFYEPGAIAVSVLCRSILSMKDRLQPSAILRDTNGVYREKRWGLWQFPKREDYTIQRDDVIRELEAAACPILACRRPTVSNSATGP